MLKLYLLKLLSKLFKQDTSKVQSYKSTRVGDKGSLYANPQEVIDEMNKLGLYERAEKIVTEETDNG